MGGRSAELSTSQVWVADRTIGKCLAEVADRDTSMTRRLTLSVVCAYAVRVWGSIGHTLLGLPDLGPVVGPMLFVATLLAPLARQSTLPAITEAPQARSATLLS